MVWKNASMSKRECGIGDRRLGRGKMKSWDFTVTPVKATESFGERYDMS